VTRAAGGVTTPAANGAGASFSFTPNDAGVYSVTLTATDKDGGTATTIGTLTVVAPNLAPVVAITGPAAGAALSVGSPVTFTGTFTDPDSPGAHTAVWTLTAPGQPAITLPGVISGGPVTATYTFHAAGIYQVALAVTDDQGPPAAPAPSAPPAPRL
jgi:PKD repeat protein